MGTNIGVVLAIRFPVHLEEAGENVPPQEADRVKERSTKLSSADDDLYLHNGDHMVNGHGGSQTEEKKEDSGLINGTNSDVSGSDPTVCERVQFDPKSESLHYSNNGKVGSINDTRDHLENGKLSNLSREMRKSSENGEFSSSTEAHLQKDTTFDYTDDVELGPSEVIESSKIVDKFTNSSKKFVCELAISSILHHLTKCHNNVDRFSKKLKDPLIIISSLFAISNDVNGVVGIGVLPFLLLIRLYNC